jgi:hypothetical protein
MRNPTLGDQMAESFHKKCDELEELRMKRNGRNDY